MTGNMRHLHVLVQVKSSDSTMIACKEEGEGVNKRIPTTMKLRNLEKINVDSILLDEFEYAPASSVAMYILL